MYYPDGTVLPTTHSTECRDNVVYRAIGWLEKGHDFPMGEIPPHVLDVLVKEIVQSPRHQMRGYHYCEWCASEDILVEHGGDHALLGSAEIWINGAHSEVFVCPSLIIHYIRDHRYLPPKSFIEAVLAKR